MSGARRYKIFTLLTICLAVKLMTSTEAAESVESHLVEKTSHLEKEQNLLEQVFSKYNKEIRPTEENVTTGPVSVFINMYVRSMEKLDEENMEMTIQLTFRQQWLDHRLAFAHLVTDEDSIKYLKLRSLDRIWMPDTFFSNERRSHIHNMMVPNTYIRIFPSGEVLYSTRMTLTLSCPMSLYKYPFDKQTCSIRLASYGFTSDDIIYKWKRVLVSADLRSQFILTDFATDNCDSVTNSGTYSCLRVDFRFHRPPYMHKEVFLMSTVFVIIAWFSFWFDPRQSPRVILTVVTLSLMTILVLIVRNTICRAATHKLIDTWTLSTFLFVSFAVVIYAIVHYLTRSELSLEQKIDSSDSTSSSDRNISASDSKSDLNIHRIGRRRRSSIFQSANSWNWSISRTTIAHYIDVAARVLYPVAFAAFCAQFLQLITIYDKEM